MEDNFLTQEVNEPTRGSALLDLLFTNREGLVGDVVVGGFLGLSNPDMRVLDSWRSKEEGQQNHYPEIQKGRFGLLKESG